VINKSDSGKQDLRLDEGGLQLAHPNIVAFLRTSCDPDDWAKAALKRCEKRLSILLHATSALSTSKTRSRLIGFTSRTE
jgi:hypothetical protein